MEITRDYVPFPEALKAVVCGGDPTQKRWNYELAASTFDEKEWMGTLGVKEKRLRKILDRQRQPAPPNITVVQGAIPYELQRVWNSVEEIWREKGADCGPFVPRCRSRNPSIAR